MKIINQFFIIIFIVTSLILIRDDFSSVYYKTILYIDNKVDTFLDKDTKQSLLEEKKLDQNDSFSEDIIKKSLNTGIKPLKISDNLFDSNKINLSPSKIIEITNKKRFENGELLAFKEDSKLNFSAEKKLQDMFIKQYFEHESPEGLSVGNLADEVSYEYITIGENLALGNFKDDEALVQAWMDSPGHRENILSNYYTEIGIATSEVSFEGRKVWMAVQHFALPKDACPVVDEVLKGIIEITQKEVDNMDQDLSIRRTMIENRVVYEGLTTNEQIDKYNSLIYNYNELVIKLKDQVKKYNQQIRAFNSCLLENTNLED